MSNEPDTRRPPDSGGTLARGRVLTPNTVRATEIVQRRRGRLRAAGPYVAAMLAVVGGIMVLIEVIVRHWLMGKAIDPWTILIGSGFAFVGAFMLDPRGAEEAGGFIVNSTVRLAGVIPGFGRRSTDRAVSIEQSVTTTPEAKATAKPEDLSGS